MSDAVNPAHYQFSNGAETIDITENLTGNGSQAVQYIVRATRLDGNNKGDLVEDIEKAIWFCRREIQRITGDYSPQRHLLGVELADLPLEYVWEGDDEDVEPRVVEALYTEYRDRAWLDKYGLIWTFFNGSWRYRWSDEPTWNDYLKGVVGIEFGPFTEVL